MIAGLLKAPSRFSPANDKDLAAERASQVLAQHGRCRLHHRAQAQAAERQKRRSPSRDRAPRQPLFRRLGRRPGRGFAGTQSRDLVVTTTLDPRMQADAEAAIEGTLDRRARNPMSGRARSSPCRPTARSAPWSAAPTTPTASSTARPRRCASPARPSSRSSISRPGARHAADRPLHRPADQDRQLGAEDFENNIAAMSPSPMRSRCRSTPSRPRCCSAMARQRHRRRRGSSASPRISRTTPASPSAPARFP